MRGRPCDERAGQPASQDADHCPRASHSPLFLVREEHGEQELEIFPLLDRFEVKYHSEDAWIFFFFLLSRHKDFRRVCVTLIICLLIL